MNTITHHGIKGMRWGVRRYQNKDGSLTPAGRKRYEKELAKTLSDAELKKRSERIAAELRYKKLVDSKYGKDVIDHGVEIVKQSAKSVLQTQLTAQGNKYFGEGLNKAIEKGKSYVTKYSNIATGKKGKK